MSIIDQVRIAIEELDRPFTIHDLCHIWTEHHGLDRHRVYKSVGTCLITLKNKHKEIVEIGKGEKSPVNGKRATIYQSCEPPVEEKRTFSNGIPACKQYMPDWYGFNT